MEINTSVRLVKPITLACPTAYISDAIPHNIASNDACKFRARFGIVPKKQTILRKSMKKLYITIARLTKTVDGNVNIINRHDTKRKIY